VWETSTTTAGGGGAGGGGGSNNEWQAHKGPVNRISWAHPEFGQLLATAGSDHFGKREKVGCSTLLHGFFELAPITRRIAL
jgi:hypothetical protein